MNNFSKVVQDIQADTNIQVTYETNKLQQVTRNRLKQALVGALMEDLKTIENIEVYDIEKGIGVRVTTIKGDKVSFVIDVTMKDMNAPFDELATEYADKVEQKSAKRQASLKLKAEKIAQDNIKRDKKRAERARKEARKEGQVNVQD